MYFILWLNEQFKTLSFLWFTWKNKFKTKKAISLYKPILHIIFLNVVNTVCMLLYSILFCAINYSKLKIIPLVRNFKIMSEKKLLAFQASFIPLT